MNQVITALRERYQIELELKALLDVQSESELKRQAKQIATKGKQVIPVILNNLNRSSPGMLNILGLVSSFYPNRSEVVNRLYEAAADETRPDPNRIAAMMILERFLGIETDPYLVGSLQNPQQMVVQAIEEMIQEGEKEPMVLIEYAQGLTMQPQDVIENVLETLLEVGKERAVPLLCLLAQQNQAEPTALALHTLGRLRHIRAVRGLQSIQPMLPPKRRLLAERNLRKLQFSNVPVIALPSDRDAWLTLISPLDGDGSQIVWFIGDADSNGNRPFLGAELAEQEGIVQTYGSYQLPAQVLPRQRHKGYIHRVSFQKDTPFYMLETDFDYGRRLVQEAQNRCFAANRPLPDEYRLLGMLIWQYDATRVGENRQAPPPPPDTARLLPQTSALLDHVAFSSWFAHGEPVVRYALIHWPFDEKESLQEWATQLAQVYFDDARLLQLQERLYKTAEWLWRAGESDLAQAATVAATTVTTTPPAAHPLTSGMARIGLRIVLEQLEEQLDF